MINKHSRTDVAIGSSRSQWCNFFLDGFTERALGGILDHSIERHTPQAVLKLSNDIIDRLVQRTERIVVFFTIKWTTSDALQWINRIHHIQQGRHARITDGSEAASATALGSNKISTTEQLEHLHSVVGRDMGSAGDLLARHRWRIGLC